MPRLRAISIACGLAGRSSGEAMASAARKLGEDGGARLHLVADGHARARAGRKVDVHAGAEADEAIALPAGEAIPRLHVAEDAACDEARDLHARDLRAVRELHHHRIALVVRGGLVER